MPCCHWVLSLAKSSSNNNTPSWLHRLHAKGGLSFPSHLQIDDLFYGQPQRSPAPPRPPPPPTLLPPPPPPPPASSDRRLAVIDPQDPLPKPKPPRDPARPNPSGNNDISYHPAQPQIQPPPPPPPLSGVISDLFAVPSAARSGRPPLKPFRKQSRPRPRPKDKSASKDDKEKAKARKRRRADRGAGVVDGERRSKTEVTVIDTSTDGWKTAKLILRRGTSFKLRDRKYSEISETEELNKGKRRAGLVAKVLRDKEKEKEAASPGNIHSGSGYLTMVPSDDAIQTVKGPRSSELVPGDQSASILLLPSSSTISQP